MGGLLERRSQGDLSLRAQGSRGSPDHASRCGLGKLKIESCSRPADAATHRRQRVAVCRPAPSPDRRCRSCDPLGNGHYRCRRHVESPPNPPEGIPSLERRCRAGCRLWHFRAQDRRGRARPAGPESVRGGIRTPESTTVTRAGDRDWVRRHRRRGESATTVAFPCVRWRPDRTGRGGPTARTWRGRRRRCA